MCVRGLVFQIEHNITRNPKKERVRKPTEHTKRKHNYDNGSHTFFSTFSTPSLSWLGNFLLYLMLSNNELMI